jgi:hypothetical protein
VEPSALLSVFSLTLPEGVVVTEPPPAVRVVVKIGGGGGFGRDGVITLGGAFVFDTGGCTTGFFDSSFDLLFCCVCAVASAAKRTNPSTATSQVDSLRRLFGFILFFAFVNWF